MALVLSGRDWERGRMQQEPTGADPVVVLTPDRPSVEPGGEVVLTASVRNPGGIVEEYELAVLGVAHDWARMASCVLSVLPGQTRQVDVVVRPPRDPTTPAGPQPIGVRAVSHENPRHMAVGETDLLVGGVHALAATLVPVRDRSRWSGRYQLELVSSGSEHATLAFATVDYRRGLSFALAPATVTVQPGDRTTVYLRARARAPKLVGRPQRHSFTLSRTPTGPGVGAARAALAGRHDGSFEQVPVLPKVALAGAALVVGAAALLVGLVLRPEQAAPTDTALAPPATQFGALLATGPNSVRLSWRSNPYADRYVLQRIEGEGADVSVRDSTEVKGDRNSVDVPGLTPATEVCFRLVAGNSDGTSVPSKPSCVRTQAAPPPSTSTSPTPTPSPTQASSTGTELTGSYVSVGSFNRADEPVQGVGRELVAALNRRGIAFRLIDGDSKDGKAKNLPFLTPGFQYVVVDGLRDPAAGQALCARLISEDAVFGNCTPLG